MQDGVNYIFVRRMDDQVKIGGYRIELQEIEAVYMQHPVVEQAVALVRDNKLVLYVKLSTSATLAQVSNPKKTLAEVTAYAARSLTYYMIPSFALVVSSFPQTANGKLDRKALPDPSPQDHTRENEGHDHSLVPNEEETKEGDRHGEAASPAIVDLICSVVFEIKGVRPKPSSSLAGIGVDSLGMIIFLRRLTDTFEGSLTLAPSELFQPNMTVERLAGIIEKRLAKDHPTLLTRLGAGHVEGVAVDVSEEDGDKEGESNSKFLAILASNQLFLEGLRGFLTILVLLDHFIFVDISVYGQRLSCDTFLFILLVGFTTFAQVV